MPHTLILKVTKFQLPPPKRLGTVVKNILGPSWPPCQIGLRPPGQTPGQIPGQDRGAKTRPLGQLKCVNPRDRPEGGWSGLELTDT